jgi:hypothetical protein
MVRRRLGLVAALLVTATVAIIYEYTSSGVGAFLPIAWAVSALR